ncbi:RsmB/NOP family class I SAM-dependent RNA methyltransferase [Arenicella xantha]|uniref:16S rRNA (Cytosine967-C5)-methyltransferase n=1 Tax=Arenicella xantha TaxID=644221 RepID=A0A395JFP6_9GAMM|nr:RsmB/NOP family class I SAM-dependent RNA methyltransferase [Arenicella xantha]RBP48580.1 16S rRNA (cytosine967-C5)-methyltransferase [Arenicella xantha]
MRPAARVQATIELLDERAESGYPADRIMAAYFKQRRYIGAKDKAAISEYFYSVLRQQSSLTFLLQSASLPTDNRWLMVALLLCAGENVAELYNGEQFSPAALSASSLGSLEQFDETRLDTAPSYIQLNVPEWLEPKLQAALGERYVDEMHAMNQRAATDIRVNTLKATREELVAELEKVGFATELTALSPWGIRFSTRVALFNTDMFRRGWFEVQDEGSQLLALLSAASPGQTIVDFCAGAGGKTLAMAAMMQNKGSLYACDVHSKRLEQLGKRKKRADIHNIRTHVLSSEHDKWVKQHSGRADTVLIDAPCSGTGTWRRSPDSRWNLQPEGLANLVALQHSILDSACRLVKPGGRLLYATCSLLQEENEEQISAFLARNSEFSASTLDLSELLPGNHERFVASDHSMRTFPGLSGTDGFFVASLVRAS